MAEDEWVYVSKEEWDRQVGSYELLCIIVPEYHDLTTINANMVNELKTERANIWAAHRECDELLQLLQRTWDAWNYTTSSEFDALKDDLRRVGVDVDHYDERACP